MSVNRHLSRIVAMQTLYEWDFHGDRDPKGIFEATVEPVGKDVDTEYALRVIAGTISKLEDIDKKIAKAAPEWPLDQIAVVDKSILRLAAYEVMYDHDIPPKVAINEAVEIAKTFGGENSSKFVNGVLGTLYRQSDRYVDEDKDSKEDDDQAKKASEKKEDDEERDSSN